MKIVSFAWTTPALVTGHKTVTRRDWSEKYAKRFKPGELCQAYNRSPRHRGECVAIIRIRSVAHERDADAPDGDYEAEGFQWLMEHPDALPKTDRFAYLVGIDRDAFEYWRQAGGQSWVCRFEVVKLTPLGQELADHWQPRTGTMDGKGLCSNRLR